MTRFPLVDKSWGNQEILSCIQTLLSGQLTMAEKVVQFETEFCNYLDVPYGVMVNSGSSANLLALSAITNPMRKNHLIMGDKVAIPAVCWSTSLWPIIQAGLVPVLIDVDPCTLNLSISSLKEAMTKHKIKGIMMVHILGNSTNMSSLLEIVKNNSLYLIEDTCESLDSRYCGQPLGTFGDFGTFSFYFSHHLTTIEGGIIVSNNLEDSDLLKCLRTHGWSREQSNKKVIEDSNPNIDPRFLFINLGYNVRPTELQASFGIEQLKGLPKMTSNRKENVQRIKQSFISHPKWNNQFKFIQSTKDLDPCWFGLPLIVSKELGINMREFISKLLDEGIDTRPIVSGNMAIQPALKHFHAELGMGPFVGAQEIHDHGLFIGCHAKPLENERINNLIEVMLRTCS